MRQLVRRLRENGLITSDRVAEVSARRSTARCAARIVRSWQAMNKVDRRNYVPDKGDAYQDSPQYVTTRV